MHHVERFWRAKREPRDLSPLGWPLQATPPTVHDRAMAGKFLPLDDHDDDEEDSLLDASVRVERFERKVMGRAWAACAILSLTFAGVALYRHMSAAPANVRERIAHAAQARLMTFRSKRSTRTDASRSESSSSSSS